MNSLQTSYGKFIAQTEPYVFLPPYSISSALWVFSMSGLMIHGALGKPAPFQKFTPTDEESKKQMKSPGQKMAFIGYGIPLVVMISIFGYRFSQSPEKLSLYEFIFGSKKQFYSILPNLMMISYFLKRVFEVNFIHIYTNKFESHFGIGLSIAYCLNFAVPLWWQKNVLPQKYLSKTKLINTGMIVYGIGSIGNFYHHYLLRKERLEKGDTNVNRYIIPEGGLFEYVWTPHYMFELMQDWGIALTSSHFAFYVTAGLFTTTLTKRAVETKKWYQDKFDDCPERKAIFPMIL